MIIKVLLILLFIFIPLTSQASDEGEFETNLDCLARNIYHESALESRSGKIAVAQIVINRIENDSYPNTICGVIHQSKIKNNKRYCQFSWVCDKRSKVKEDSKAWLESLDVAFHIMTGNLESKIIKNTKALYFHNDSVVPTWSLCKSKVVKIGNHTFYADKNNKRAVKKCYQS